MFALKRLIVSSLFVFVVAVTALAQESRAPFDNPREQIVAAAPLVTAAATAKRVRFVSPGTVVQLRLEVYNETGQKLFDTELHGGNVLDWHLLDGAGERLPSGSYACVLTIKSLSGRLSQRVGLVTVNDRRAAIKTAGAAELSMAQQQTIGPVEGNAAFTILQPSEAEAITAVTHDGTQGQLTSTTGPLTFRTGNLFSGKDKEQMRITEDGRVGIGTDKPEATLDVAGTVRVSEGLRFSDGTTLAAAAGKFTVRDAKGDPVLDSFAAGTGTQNQVAKWSETGGAGTLVDSTITELNGKVGIGTANPGTQLHIYGTAPSDVFAGMGPDVNVGPAFNFGYAGFSFGRGAGFFNVRPDALATAPNPSLRFMTANVQRMIITNTGDVGIGNLGPGAKLDVTGNINTSTQYNIAGNRILSVPGNGNTFTGIGAGTSSTGTSNSFFGRNAGGALTNSGSSNSFFGDSAGSTNTTGGSNSFFGSGAGGANTTGASNSFFGWLAGAANTTGASNSFFGKQTGDENTTGDFNSFFGTAAGGLNTTGSDNSFFGYHAGQLNKTGGGNAFFGAGAGLNNTGSSNSFFGAEAGYSNESGLRNAFFGRNAGRDAVSGNDNTFVGYVAGDSSTGSDNTFVGSDAGGATTSGVGNTFSGSDAGDANTEGNSNTFMGKNAGNTNTTGSANTILGYGADVGSSGLIFATAIGANAVVNNNNSVVLGRGADTVRIPGDLIVTGTVSKGGGSFKIDHPLDPANKTLSHSFVESPDMMNVYNGNTTTDARGLAIVTLPNYFEALNRDFRYQLTVIGQFAQAIVLEEITSNRFRIKTSRARVKVSWQVTGVRQDAYANARRIPTEELKPEAERGTFLHPDMFTPKPTATTAMASGTRTAIAKPVRSRR